MKYFLFTIILCWTVSFTGVNAKEPVTVILTAGQSNTDGRILNEFLPAYIQANKYKYCHWMYGSAGQLMTDGFELFWPRINNPVQPDKWAYDAVTYYFLEQAIQKPFYVVKWSLGGTAIDTGCRSNSEKYWNASPEFLAKNHSTLTGGKSLLLSFTETISLAVDSTLASLPEGYEVKAFLWHQGESDCQCGKNYYQNLKQLVNYVRDFLVKKTGSKHYNQLPFICGTVSRVNRQYNKDVERAMLQLSKEDKNFYVIDMSEAGLQKDQLHFTQKSAEYLGVQIYNKLVDLGVAGKNGRKAEVAFH
ncbi:sialate O-acetylesterase [Phocaeicola sp.]